MKRSFCQPLEVETRFQNLHPLQSPDKSLTTELALVGYWAAQKDGIYFVLVGYRGTDSVIDAMRAAANPWLTATFGKTETIEVEEYETRDDWRRRVLQLITPPRGGADMAGAGVPRKPTPSAPAFPFAEPWPEGAS